MRCRRRASIKESERERERERREKRTTAVGFEPTRVTPMDFKSIALTTRPSCRATQALPTQKNYHLTYTTLHAQTHNTQSHINDATNAYTLSPISHTLHTASGFADHTHPPHSHDASPPYVARTNLFAESRALGPECSEFDVRA